MHAAFVETPAGDTFHDVKRFIWKMVNTFHRRFGGDREEYLAEAYLTFQKVHGRYDASKGTFCTVLGTAIWRKLSQVNRKNLYRWSKCPEHIEGDCEDRHDKTRAMEMWDALTEDARYVVALVLDPPPLVAEVAEGKGGCPMNWRSTVRQYLRDLGWAGARIAESFDEIRKALP